MNFCCIMCVESRVSHLAIARVEERLQLAPRHLPQPQLLSPLRSWLTIP